MAYVLLSELRRIALRHTQFADATCGTIRLKLLKIGALVRRSVRRIKFAMASGFPWQTEFALAYLYLQPRLPAIAEPDRPRPIQAPSPRHVRRTRAATPMTRRNLPKTRHTINPRPRLSQRHTNAATTRLISST